MPDRPTTVKQRFVAAGPGVPAQLLRVDRESRTPLPPRTLARLFERVEGRLREHACVVVADHGKGACPVALLGAVLGSAARRGIPVLVDPARLPDWGRYYGAEALLPNRAEAGAKRGAEWE